MLEKVSLKAALLFESDKFNICRQNFGVPVKKNPYKLHPFADFFPVFCIFS
jgi:hypothetical protein